MKWPPTHRACGRHGVSDLEQINVRHVVAVIIMARDLVRSERELRAFLTHMDPEAQATLVSVMWIGREAFEPSDWDEAYATAMAEASTPTADYLIGTPHLADNLEAGLEALGFDVAEEEEIEMGRWQRWTG